MVLSMTGFGKASEDFADKSVTVEVKSLNSKQFDLSLRIPSVYREKEMEIRSEVQKLLDRGKIDLAINVENRNETPSAVINQPVATEYGRQIKNLADSLGEKSFDLIGIIMRMPDVFKNERKELSDEEWNQVWKVCVKAIDKMIEFRKTEGKSLESEFKKRVGLIQELAAEVDKLDAARTQNIRDRIKNNLADVIPVEKIDQNRFEQELIFYLEKLDITEEKVRLKTHCEYFLNTMKEPACGRKLNFISQEMGREINTIGSKANDAPIQKLVVQMKDELERIKEQSMNVL